MLRELFLELLAPLRCAACDRRTRDLFCEVCVASVEPSIDPGRAVFSYGGAVEIAIQRYKFQSRPDLAIRFAGPLAEAAARFAVDLVVPVPLHPLRLVERGFDQASLLARPVARRIGAGFDPRLLRRVRNTPKQSKLARAERLHNVVGAFRCVRSTKGLKILLIDDVATTGSTLAACRETLIEAGAREVVPFVIALRDELTSLGRPSASLAPCCSPPAGAFAPGVRLELGMEPKAR